MWWQVTIFVNAIMYYRVKVSRNNPYLNICWSCDEWRMLKCSDWPKSFSPILGVMFCFASLIVTVSSLQFLQQFFVLSIKYRGSNDRVWLVHIPHLSTPSNRIPFLPWIRLPRLITRIQDPISAVTNVDDYSGSARLLAATTLRNVLGTRNLGDILSERESIAQEMQASLRAHHELYIISSGQI